MNQFFFQYATVKKKTEILNIYDSAKFKNNEVIIYKN